MWIGAAHSYPSNSLNYIFKKKLYIRLAPLYKFLTSQPWLWRLGFKLTSISPVRISKRLLTKPFFVIKKCTCGLHQAINGPLGYCPQVHFMLDYMSVLTSARSFSRCVNHYKPSLVICMHPLCQVQQRMFCFQG